MHLIIYNLLIIAWFAIGAMTILNEVERLEQNSLPRAAFAMLLFLLAGGFIMIGQTFESIIAAVAPSDDDGDDG